MPGPGAGDRGESLNLGQVAMLPLRNPAAGRAPCGQDDSGAHREAAIGMIPGHPSQGRHASLSGASPGARGMLRVTTLTASLRTSEVVLRDAYNHRLRGPL